MHSTFGRCDSCGMTTVLGSYEGKAICLDCISDSPGFINASWEVRQGIMVFFADAQRNHDAMQRLDAWLHRCLGDVRYDRLTRIANSLPTKVTSTALATQRPQDGRKGH